MSAVGPSPWRGRHLPVTIGVFSLTFLFAFEAVAVATIMPEIAEVLDGLGLYAISFAAPTAAGIVAMTIAGQWCDRRGPRPVLNLGVAVFIVGLLIAGTAPSMAVFLAGRAIHGFGAGLMGVALYVVVAQAFEEELRARVFSVLSAAWLLPAIVGPVIVAHVAQWWTWRAVFLGVPVLAISAWLLVARTPSAASTQPAAPAPPVVASILAAGGVFLISIAGQGDLPLWQLLLVLGIGVVVVAGKRLLPAGTWTGARGLASLITVRSAVWAGFIGTEAYLPLMMVLQRGLTLAEAGVMLSITSIFWFGGSWMAGRVRLLVERRDLTLNLGIGCSAVGLATVATVGLGAVPLAVPVLGWALATTGVGLVIPTVAVLALGSVSEAETGRASSALQLNDALAHSMVLAVGSVFFATVATTHPVRGGSVLILVAALIAASAWLPAQRTRTAADRV